MTPRVKHICICSNRLLRETLYCAYVKVFEPTNAEECNKELNECVMKSNADTIPTGQMIFNDKEERQLSQGKLLTPRLLCNKAICLMRPLFPP